MPREGAQEALAAYPLTHPSLKFMPLARREMLKGHGEKWGFVLDWMGWVKLVDFNKRTVL